MISITNIRIKYINNIDKLKMASIIDIKINKIL